MSGMNLVFSEPSSNAYPWNYNLSGMAISPAQYASFSPYQNDRYSPLSFQQRSVIGEPLPTPFASLQANALQSIAMYRYQQTPQINPQQTFANFGGLNEFGFGRSQFPPEGLPGFQGMA